MTKKKVWVIAAAVGTSALGILGFMWYGMPLLLPHEPPQNDMTVDKPMRNEVIEAVIANFNRAYVFPDKALAVEKDLRQRLQHGDFDSITSAEKFADTLTDILQHDTGNDRHIELRYFEKPIAEQPANGEQSPQEVAEELTEQKRRNFGLESVGRFRGNIGYINLHFFSRPQAAVERIAAAMSLLADTGALIIDLRQCHGGDPETVMLFASYLFDRRTHLNDIYFRDENRTEERWTTDGVPGKKYGQSRKIYLLTSSETFSGCEDFAYALKNAGRATLIGETTGGGAHAGSPRRLSAHFMVFVPSGLPINPVTHTDWEGVGVVPDIRTSVKNALDLAQISALKELISVETDLDWKARLQEQLADLE
jgi:C-terminal processing protease CtpA/Prc